MYYFVNGLKPTNRMASGFDCRNLCPCNIKKEEQFVNITPKQPPGARHSAGLWEVAWWENLPNFKGITIRPGAHNTYVGKGGKAENTKSARMTGTGGLRRRASCCKLDFRQ